MTDCTHKRYLIENQRNGKKKTIVRKVGEPPSVPSGWVITACLGGMNLSGTDAKSDVQFLLNQRN